MALWISFLLQWFRTKSRNTLSNHARHEAVRSWHLSSLGDWSGIAKCWSAKRATSERRLCDTVYKTALTDLMFLDQFALDSCRFARVFSLPDPSFFWFDQAIFLFNDFFASSSCSLRCEINSRLENISSFFTWQFLRCALFTNRSSVTFWLISFVFSSSLFRRRSSAKSPNRWPCKY